MRDAKKKPYFWPVGYGKGKFKQTGFNQNMHPMTHFSQGLARSIHF